MSKIKEILTRINSIKSTKKITQAMKMVSTSKLAKVEERAHQLTLYNDTLKSIVDDLSIADIDSELINKYTNKNNLNSKVMIVLLSSDRGLCGSFNTNLFKEILSYTERLKVEKKDFKFLTLGKKGIAFCEKYNFEYSDEFVTIFNDISSKNVFDISSEIMKSFEENKYGEIFIAHNKKVNKTTIEPVIEDFLPLNLENNNNDINSADQDIYIYEPNKVDLLENVIPELLHAQFMGAIINSLAAEHSSRVMAMTKATDNADDMLKDLQLLYNRTRQAAITKELSEIVGGAEALKGGH